MEHSPYLKPMRPDALTRRPVQQAQFDTPKVKLVPMAKPSDSGELRAPVFAPVPVRSAPTDDELDQLLNSFFESEEEEDVPDDSGDAVPTSQMPVPVCVPLFEEPKKHWWQKR